MNVVVVDDELSARENIKHLLDAYYPEMKVVGEADSVQSAKKVLEIKKADLVFLDVDLSDGSAFDLLHILNNMSFTIIFVSAHMEYALQAIKFSALDFILKPVNSTEFIAAVNKAKDKVKHDDQNLKLQVLLDNSKLSTEQKKKIVLKTSDSIHLVQVNRIVRCEADNNYTRVYISDGKKIIVSKGLKEYEELFKDAKFLRVHQSHLVNIDFISRFDKKDGGYLVLEDKTKIPVSTRKKQQLLEIINNMDN